LGHTVTIVVDTTVTDSNLSAYDLIVNADPLNSTWANLATYYEGYMTSDSIPFVFLASLDGLSNGQPSTDTPEAKLGVVANVRRTAADYGYTGQRVLMHEDHQDTVVGKGFPVEQSFRWSKLDVSVSPAAGKAIVAGTKFLELDNGEPAGSLIASGDARVGQGSGTFPVNVAWLGALAAFLSKENASLLLGFVILGDLLLWKNRQPLRRRLALIHLPLLLLTAFHLWLFLFRCCTSNAVEHLNQCGQRCTKQTHNSRDLLAF